MPGHLLPLLPAAALLLLVYWGVLRGERARVVVIALASMALLALLSPRSVIPLLAVTAIVYRTGQCLRDRPGALRLALAVLVPGSLLVLFKYLGPALHRLEIVPWIIRPLGISYYTFKHIHYLVECSRGRFRDSRFDEYLAYVTFLPMFLAGPIERYDRFAADARGLRFRWSDVSLGLERMLIGALKKFLLADLLLAPLLPDRSVLSDAGGPALGWGAIAFAGFVKFLRTYMDFSGYTDMVLGAGRLFGFRLAENFDFPFLRPNLAEFWKSWHMSLSGWARDYVYLPLLGRYRSTTLALIGTMMMIGLWHDAAAGWLLWGLHHGLGLAVLARYQRRARSVAWIQRLRATRASHLLGVLAVWWYVSLAHVLTFDASLRISLRLYLEAWTFGWLP